MWPIRTLSLWDYKKSKRVVNPHFPRGLSRLAGIDEPLGILQSPREEYRELSGAAGEALPREFCPVNSI